MIKEMERKRIKDFTTLLNCMVVPCILGCIWMIDRWWING